MDLTFKNQREEYPSNQNYCITISIQKISVIHKFILKIQQSLESHELKTMAIFDHAHPNITESTFSFPEFVQAC